jgi:hypothetical protein
MKQMLRRALKDEEMEGLATEWRISHSSAISTGHFALCKCTQHPARFRNPTCRQLDPPHFSKDASRIASDACN